MGRSSLASGVALKKKPGDYESPGFQVLSLSCCGSDYKTEGQSMATEAPLTVEERYVSATHASNLRVQSERGGSADVIIAAGMSPARLGAALLRLHSEFDSAEKPRRMQREAIEVLAQTLPRLPNKSLDMKAAHKTAHAWHLHELKILMGKLKTLPAVRINLVAWASMNLMADADKRVAEVLIWWLNHVCLVCEGRGKEKIPGTPSLSHRDCRDCLAGTHRNHWGWDCHSKPTREPAIRDVFPLRQ